MHKESNKQLISIFILYLFDCEFVGIRVDDENEIFGPASGARVTKKH